MEGKNNGMSDNEWSISLETSYGVFVNGYVFLQKDQVVSITYDGAYVSGGDQSGSQYVFTTLYKNGEEVKSEQTIAYVNDVIEVYETNITNTTNRKLLFKTSIVQMNSGCIYSSDMNLIANYNGDLCSFSDTISLNSFPATYKLKISSNNAYGKGESISGSKDIYPLNGNWYVSKGQEIKVSYTPARVDYGYGGGNEQGSSSTTYHYYTDLIIKQNGEQVNTTSASVNWRSIINENITINDETTIELFYIKEDNSKITKTKQVNITIHIDDSVPGKPSVSGGCEKASNGDYKWTKDNLTIEAKESGDGTGTGVSYYEYQVGTSDWIRGNIYNTNVSDGSILDTKVKFRTVDYVGHVSESAEAVVKIDINAPVVSAKNTAEITRLADTWYNEDIIISAMDEGSGMGFLYINEVEQTNPYKIEKSGTYKVTATDCVANTSTEIYKVDKTDPEIIGRTKDGISYNWEWTNQNVTVRATDEHSGIAEFIVAGNKETWEKELSGTGTYTVTAKDNVGRTSSKTIKIDQTKPVSTWKTDTFNGFEYIESGETRYLNNLSINYSVKEDHSGIADNKNILKLNGTVISESKEKAVSYKDTDRIGNLTRDSDEILTYTADVTDEATNAADTIEKTLTIPRKIVIRIVGEGEETSDAVRTRLTDDGYTTAGILINKIDFSLYKTLKLRRTFLGDKAENSTERQVIDYDTYRSYFDGTVEETYVQGLWNDLQECSITAADVKDVTVGDQEYWYYEDKILTASGMGHRGIRYQAEWEWNLLAVTERGLYTEIDKTENFPGELKIRIEGTDQNGKESRHIVLDKDGNKIESESDSDFYVPVDGVVKLAFRIEDEDAETYIIDGMEHVQATFINEATETEEEQNISVAIEGSHSDGYIQKKKLSGSVKSGFRKDVLNNDGWYEFDIPELKLYYNKPFNMSITMIEGCRGSNGAYKDVTTSGMIKLKADNPDLGGFRLLVGESAGYNTDGITARPHQKVKLDIKGNEGSGTISGLTWDYGDGTAVTEAEKDKDGHAYGQSPERTGNTSEYILRISLEQDQTRKNAELNVHIVDTQYGVLLGDETWIGKHPVLNKVQVGNGTTLKIINNDNDENNPTVVLGIGSALDENKGQIEILNGGNLEIEGSKDVKILITEGENGTEFTEVKTEKDGGKDDSLKWKGMTLRTGSKASIKNAEIKYAQTGIEVVKAAETVFEDTEIKNCSIYGMTVNGTVTGKSIRISGCEDGLAVENGSSMTVTETLGIADVKNGIVCNGEINAENITLLGITERGIVANGDVIVTGSIVVSGTGSEGLKAGKTSEVKAKDIKVLGFAGGILVEGTVEAEGSLEAEGSTEYGVKNEGSIEAKGLVVKNASGRGYVAAAGSHTEFEESEVSAERTGIHCVGNAEADFGKCSITGGTYGIKTDEDESGEPDLKIDEESSIIGSTVRWYDWKDGVLTDNEMNSKKSR